MKKTHMIAALSLMSVLILFCISCGQSGASDQAGTDSLFEYAVNITDGLFSPGHAQFLMSAEELAEANHIDTSQVSEGGQEGERIVNKVKLEGLSGELTEIYNFDENKLMSVEYVIAAEESEYGELCNTLYEQAKAWMPAPSTDNLEEIKEGKNTVMWFDEEQNSVVLSFPMTKADEPRAIILAVYATRGDRNGLMGTGGASAE